MNKKFNLIVNILIIALIVALVYVMMNYYTGTSSKVPTNIDVIDESIIPTNKENTIISNNKEEENKKDTIINIKDSGEIEKNSEDIKIESGENSGEVSTENLQENEEKENISKNNEIVQNENQTVIMTSENEISSKEKREILTELDKTLMELLDVVEKVQTVDESRLIIDDSEVQE